jgi:pyruvate dehydrogenase phosphatase
MPVPLIPDYFAITSTPNQCIHLTGHRGSRTSEYTSINLTRNIHNELYSMALLDQIKGPESISEMLSTQVLLFDFRFNRQIRRMCPNPQDLTHEAALAIINAGIHRDILNAACSGTTFAAVLIDGSSENIWCVGLGDSSIGLSSPT